MKRSHFALVMIFVSAVLGITSMSNELGMLTYLIITNFFLGIMFICQTIEED